MKKSIPFNCKIPAQYWEDIFDWYSVGMKKRAIIAKLDKEKNYQTSPRTLERLLSHMKSEAQAFTSSIIAQQSQKNVFNDFQELQRLYNEVKEVARVAYQSDHNLYLRAIDRMTKFLSIKMAINIKQDDKQEVEDESILESLLEKIGK